MIARLETAKLGKVTQDYVDRDKRDPNPTFVAFDTFAVRQSES